MQDLVFVGDLLQGLVFVVWFLLAGEAREWKVWSSGWQWKRAAQELVLVTSEAGRLAQDNPCFAVLMVEVGDNLPGGLSLSRRSWWR